MFADISTEGQIILSDDWDCSETFLVWSGKQQTDKTVHQDSPAASDLCHVVRFSILKTPVDIPVVCETEYLLLLLLSRENQLLFRNCCHKVRFVTWNTKYSTYN